MQVKVIRGAAGSGKTTKLRKAATNAALSGPVIELSHLATPAVVKQQLKANPGFCTVVIDEVSQIVLSTLTKAEHPGQAIVVLGGK